ncbi:MAG TPA: chemotaxis protein CheA [Dissulfurispiraceae bacterium]|nr:chemotaxis protein CheA [Dissulfurispiraceae bacterium]
MTDFDILLEEITAILIQLEPENLTELREIRSRIETFFGSMAGIDLLQWPLNNVLIDLDDLINTAPINFRDKLMKVLDHLHAMKGMPKQQEPCIPGAEEDRTKAVRQKGQEPGTGCTQEATALPTDPDRELIGEFVTESKDLLEKAEAALLLLESDPTDMDSVNTVFRTFHTIKGNSGFLGLLHVQEFAHRAESLLSRVRDREIRFGGIYADLALRSTDILKELTEGVQEMLAGKESLLPAGYREVIQLLDNPSAAEQKSPGSHSAEKGHKDEPTSIPSEVPNNILKNTGYNSRRTQRKTPTEPDSSLRVRTDRLDRLVDMVGELVIAQSMLAQDTIVHQSGNHELLRKVAHSGKIVRELQDLAMSMRMVPLKGTFQKIARLVRDLAQKSDKSVEFVGEGEETEIDRNMVDVLNDPLVHMVRNAIDHGIESPEIRSALGKPPTGTIRLSAYHSRGNVVLELRDDGKGLDRDKIVQKAIEKGLLDSEKNLSESEALKLIFLPGFSTADKVTEISGRGVGMDVVVKNVETLHGRINVASEPGKGCTFFVRLPLTLAVTDGMLVKVGDQRYIIPTVNIHLSLKPERSALSTVAGQGEMVMLRGDLIPVFRLHSLFSIDTAVTDPVEGLLVIIGEGGKRCALLVDELIGQQQVVAKSLGEVLAKIPGISGGAILGDGRVGLILDASGIVSLTRERTAA